MQFILGRAEFHYAMGDHSRTRRFPRVYERIVSYLSLIKFWRVCVDEAQMVERRVNT